MEKECEALPGVAYPGVRDNRSTINTKTGYDDDDADILKIPTTICMIFVTLMYDLYNFYSKHMSVLFL